MMPLKAFIRQQTCRASWRVIPVMSAALLAGEWVSDELGLKVTGGGMVPSMLQVSSNGSPRSPIVILVATNDSTASENGMEPAQACAENSKNRHPPRSVAVLNGTNEERVAAILEDAEEIYLEAARIVGHKPRIQIQATALSQLETQWGSGQSFQEHCFQAIYFDMTDRYRTKKVHDLTSRQENTLIRVGQFDNFIFTAVGRP